MRIPIGVIALAATILGDETAFADGYDYTMISDPLATLSADGTGGTEVLGINNTGTIVGTYSDSNGFHGFTEAGGSYTTLDDPSALLGETAVTGINNDGTVVGYYYNNPALLDAQAFIYSGGHYADINIQGQIPTGINDAGATVGSFGDAKGEHGFVFSNGKLTPIDDPLGKAPGYTGGPLEDQTYALGINDSGSVAGYYLTAGPYAGSRNAYGFTDVGGVFTTIEDPLDFNTANGTTDTVVLGLSDNGAVTGIYYDSTGQHGFAELDNVYTPINLPWTNISDVTPYGINDQGQVVGTYFDGSGEEQGFLATPVPESESLALFCAGIAGFGLIRRRHSERMKGGGSIRCV